MLGKLLKYELKASARTLLPLYAGTLLMALVCGISMAVQTSNMRQFKQSIVYGTAVTFGSFSDPIDGGINTFIGFGMLLVFAFCVAVTVLTVMCVVQRFNHGIAGDEGYLMFTLPVQHDILLTSKLLGALVWSFASMVVIFLVGVLIGGPSLFVERAFLDWPFLWERISELFVQWDLLLPTLLTLLNVELSVELFILIIYLAIMIGQMEQFNKYRVAVAVVAFFVINWAIGLLDNVLFGFQGLRILPESAAYAPSLNVIIGCDCLLNAVLCIVCFLATVWMMKKKLNL